MSDNNYTVLFKQSNESRFRRFVISKTFGRPILIGAIAVLVLSFLSPIGLIYYAKKYHSARALLDQNEKYRIEMETIRKELDVARDTLERVRQFDKKLRVMTSLEDPERFVALGPLSLRDPEWNRPEFEGLDTPFLEDDLALYKRYDFQNLKDQLERLKKRSLLQEMSLQELQEVLAGQKSLLAHVPSIKPSRGWLTSGFGPRISPWTGGRIMHEGIDISNISGTPVVAPADGEVAKITTEDGYGKVLVIDHGYAVSTRYAHLSKVMLKVGDKVERKQKVAEVGNTGRSTGPHLHYEVRVNGVPVDPEKYILK